MKTTLKIVVALVLLALAAGALVWALNVRGEVDVKTPVAAAAPSDSMVARGAYLARAGNCQTCHTAQGGQPYAGGLGIATPFGTVFTSNLTPDDKTGIGAWSSSHFWRAMHNGRSKDGRLLYPAFPYTSYTQVTREDSDAIFAYLGSLPAVVQPNQPHALRFPYQSQAALAVWRALYFSPGVYEPDTARNAEWNRGAYLVKGLGHCAACHTARNALGATEQSLDLAGGLIPMQNWYAPSLTSPYEAGVSDWDKQHIVSLLKNGVSPRASVTGPMAEVVQRSTQYLSNADLGAMAQFLKELPASHTAAPQPAAIKTQGESVERAAKLYEQNCAQCHGAKGEGIANAYPALAGNRAVTMPQASNLVQIVLNGGYAPATEGNPRPFGMPPFVLVLDDADMALVLTHIRQSWGNRASEITPVEVNRIRANSGR
ncbi:MULTISPECIES: cytochrome c [unclassified Polaromonas]|uniref:c-type cytochrome n=1 Tax=unclassified Polaromonas TaxID=2638319 RepID=UPI000F0903A2|nr:MULTISPECIES: cytochrome c [unclassified Polaromonas]AYQ28876.1 cytochrome c [Polaromonas sp. SP1]QGJ20008.1 c-type cytochrome [Polaromonas sp. Pch-P]